jgi:tetratricopeptide (TPR) repeat protein
VVPFSNVTHATESDWLSDASVNLLYLDMSRWRDIRVIDDERVADLIRAVPGARANAQLTLQSAIAVARHAGAGWLVMGDVLRVGNRTELVGKIFDVRSGQRLRTVRQVVTQPDSIMAAFNRLARAVLNVDPPAGSSLGTVGTTSIQAYQAYVQGVGYLNRWLLDSAQAEFTRAIENDSTFALAHYKLALVFGWTSALTNAEAVRHAGRAVALGTSLPPRERLLVTGYAHFVAGRYPEACTIFDRMVRNDSSDVEAWYNLGECSFHDQTVLPVSGDSNHFVFRSSWNVMLRAFRKTLELDPTYHLAFQHIQDALLARSRNGCRLAADETVCSQRFVFKSALLRRGDTLVTIPTDSEAVFQDQVVEGQRTGAHRQNLLEARRDAEAWLAAGPGESQPLIAYFRILLRVGDLSTADSVLRVVAPQRLSGFILFFFLADRFELALKLGHGAVAAELADSLAVLTDSTSSHTMAVVLSSIVGRSAGLEPAIHLAVQGPPWVSQYLVEQARALVGAPADGVFEAEAIFSQNVLPGFGIDRTISGLAPSLVWADFARRHGRWPVTDTMSTDPRVALISVLATGDTARLRFALARFDSIAAARRDDSDMGYALLGANAHLVIGDTAGALNHLRAFRDITWAHTPALDQLGPGLAFSGMLWPRTLLLLADLAAATGQREEAARAYRLFVEMWEHGDPEVQPIVQRARAALAGL